MLLGGCASLQPFQASKARRWSSSNSSAEPLGHGGRSSDDVSVEQHADIEPSLSQPSFESLAGVTRSPAFTPIHRRCHFRGNVCFCLCLLSKDGLHLQVFFGVWPRICDDLAELNSAKESVSVPQGLTPADCEACEIRREDAQPHPLARFCRRDRLPFSYQLGRYHDRYLACARLTTKEREKFALYHRFSCRNSRFAFRLQVSKSLETFLVHLVCPSGTEVRLSVLVEDPPKGFHSLSDRFAS